MLFIFWGCPRKYVFERCAGIQGKKAAAVQRPPQPFSATIIPCRPPCRRRARAHSSRSPDSRLVSACTAFSGLLRMAGFRRVQGLRAYSGGTVPDSDRIPYSLPFRCGRAALERSVFRRNYILRPRKSQPSEGTSVMCSAQALQQHFKNRPCGFLADLRAAAGQMQFLIKREVLHVHRDIHKADGPPRAVAVRPRKPRDRHADTGTRSLARAPLPSPPPSDGRPPCRH